MKLTLQNSANGLVGVLIVAFGSLGISGGPVYPLGTNVVGSYGGVLMPGCAACNGQREVAVRCGEKFDTFLEKHSDFMACPEANPDNPACSANATAEQTADVKQK